MYITIAISLGMLLVVALVSDDEFVSSIALTALGVFSTLMWGVFIVICLEAGRII